MEKLINFLRKPKHRMVLMAPQTVTWAATTLLVWIDVLFDYGILNQWITPIAITQLSSSILIVFGFSFILYTDHKVDCLIKA